MNSLAIIFGGYSFEHEISIVSAIAMKKAIKDKFDFIFIDRDKEFYQIPYETIKSNLFSSGEYKKCKRLYITDGGFYYKTLFGTTNLNYETVLNLIHGGNGEDGVLASLFDFFDINYIGPRVEASVVSFNKYLTKSYAKSCGVKTVDFKYFTKDDKIDIDKFPVIIKPTRLGSSIGVSIVEKEDELSYALDVAFEFDDEIIVEPFIDGVKEYNLAGCKIDGEFKFSIIEEPNKQKFLDFEKKYLDFNRTDAINSADISNELQQKIKRSFEKIYNNRFTGSLIRCDFFVIEEEVYLNEINPIPGSMANYLFDNFDEVIKKLSKSLPKNKKIAIDYTYVNKIQSAKGKL